MKTSYLLPLLICFAFQVKAQNDQEKFQLSIVSASHYDRNEGTWNGRCGKYNDSTGEFCDCNYNNCVKVNRAQVNFRQCCKPISVNLADIQNKEIAGILERGPGSNALVFKTDTVSFLLHLSRKNAILPGRLEETPVLLTLKNHVASVIKDQTPIQ